MLAAASWLGQAQDATRDGGVASSFILSSGWTSSYPETTGYLIPTFLRLANQPGLGEFEERAARAIEFLLGCQLRNGGFPGDEIERNTTEPSVFNSAQIVCGLVAWHRHTGDQRVLDAAVRAGDWLVSVQDEDGAWRRHVYNELATAYTAHASCWLAELGEHAGIQHHRDAALRHLKWTLSLADPQTDWFDRAGFTAQEHKDRVAVTHTIAYTLWGVLMTSELLGVEEGIAVVERASWAIANRLELLHRLPGVLDWRWRSRANFACVTGAAQMSLIWMRLFERQGDARLMDAATLAIDTVKRAQVMHTSASELLGAIPGSDPVWGAYMRFAYPDWAAKFFIDALCEKRRLIDIAARSDLAMQTPPGRLIQD